MGVVYKLKADVVDFVVQQKRQNPQISCRSLTTIINEAFRIKISKSSVNAILKKAKLSSPIGRRPAFGRAPKKFKIPEHKKQALFPKDAALKLEPKTTIKVRIEV